MRRMFTKKVKIPSYHVKRAILLGYKDRFRIGTMVETGTFLGDTVEFFRHKMDMVYSIELSEELAAKAVKRFEGISNVRIIQGDSGVILADLVKQVPSTALFWLDGHYSSEFYVNDEFIRTARTDKDTPIMKELDVLLNDARQHVILIDDARCFNGQGDYPTVDTIRGLVKQSKFPYDVFIQQDIINIVPAEESKQ